MTQFLTSAAAVLGFVLVATGAHLLFSDATSTAARLSQLMHVVSGLLLLLPGVVSLRRHWVLRGGDTLGYVSGGAFAVLLVSGVVVTVVASAGYIGPGWLLPVHSIGALAFLASVGAHTVIAYRKRPGAKWTSRFAIPALGGMLTAVVAGALLITPLAAPPAMHTVPPSYSVPFEGGPFAPSQVSLVESGLASNSAFSNSLACRDCHAEIYQQWSESMHRHSATDPHVDTGIRWFQRDNGVEAGRFCAGCHNPIGLLAGAYDPATTHEEVGTPPEDQGISCMVCHATVHVGEAPLGNGSYRLKVPELPLKPADWFSHTAVLLDPRAHGAEMLTAAQKTPQFCGSCHRQFTPKALGGPGPAGAHSQFVEWSESKFGQSGDAQKTCNDCHMPLVQADDPAADEQGRVRSHRFLGANHAHAVASGYETQAALQLEMIRSGLEFDVEHSASEKSGYLAVDVSVANVGVGHRFPSGTTDLSETWLEVTLSDGDRILYKSGHLDSKHYLDPEAKQWRTVFVDGSNVPVDLHNLAIVKRTVVDDYIAPGAKDTGHYEIPIAQDAPQAATLRVRLRMRKTNQRWNDWLTNFDGTTVEITDVFDESREIALSSIAAAVSTGREVVAIGPNEPSPTGMVFVPSGMAIIGSEDGDADETPMRSVYVEGFHIDRYPVTNAAYRRFLVATNRAGPVHRLEWANPYNWTGQDFPPGTSNRAAVLITHEEAAAYCLWSGKRLPLEVEWEKAARGPAGQRYPWGDEWEKGRCPAVLNQDIPERVGMCPERKSPYGVEDLVGSTWEWVQDYYRAYDRTHLHPNANEWITSFGDPSYALRGVPSGHAGPGTTGASRAGHADNMRAKIGFRCAIDAKSPAARGARPKTSGTASMRSTQRQNTHVERKG